MSAPRLILLVIVALAVGAGASRADEPQATSLRPASEGGECVWQDNIFADEDGFSCPGFGGYEVFIRIRGVDSWPALKRNGRLYDPHDEIVRRLKADVVTLTGEPMEWRPSGSKPGAVIFQVRAESDNGRTETVYLVGRLTAARFCLAGQAAGLAEARRIADAGGGCRA